MWSHVDNAHWDRSKSSYSLGVQLKSVESFKDLGITINYDLSWGKHVSYIVNKAKKSIFWSCHGSCSPWCPWQGSNKYLQIRRATCVLMRRVEDPACRIRQIFKQAYNFFNQSPIGASVRRKAFYRYYIPCSMFINDTAIVRNFFPKRFYPWSWM